MRKINKKGIKKYDTGTDYVMSSNGIPIPTVESQITQMKAPSTANWVGPSKGQIFGAKLSGAMGGITSGISGLANAFKMSQEEGVSAKSVLSGAGAGAMAGMQVAGPWGALIGGAAGAIAGSVGRKASTDEVTGDFTASSGIAGWFQSDKKEQELKEQSNRIKTNWNYRDLSASVAADYAQNHKPQGNTLAADGGIIPTTYAYLDDGELGRTPNGQLFEIPEKHKPEDSNLAKVPIGTQILSDKIKVPGTNKTFAEKGKEIMALKKQNGNSIYAKNSKMLNDRNAQIAFDRLLDLQESLKDGKHIKTNKYNNGTGWVAPIKTREDYLNGVYNITKGKQKLDDINSYWGWDSKAKDYTKQYRDLLSTFDKDKDLQAKAIKDLGSLGYTGGTWAGIKKAALDGIVGDVHRYFNAIGSSSPELTPVPEITKHIVTPEVVITAEKPTTTSTPIPTSEKKITSPVTEQTTDKNYDWLYDGISSLGTLASMLPGASAEAETAPLRTYTPRFNNVYYNIEPLIREANTTNTIARNNMAQLSPSTGAGMQYGLLAAVNRNRAIADAYNQKYNFENQQRAANTAIYNNWAARNREYQHQYDVENAQNRAAADNIRRQSWSDFGTALQTMAKDRRLAKRDEATLAAMEDFLKYGMETGSFNKLMSLLKG